jgi:hypothetical protein
MTPLTLASVINLKSIPLESGSPAIDIAARRIDGKFVNIPSSTHLMTFKDADTDDVITTCNPRPHRSQNAFDLLLQLDSSKLPGISRVEFQTLFAKCRACDLYMMRRVFEDHACASPTENTDPNSNAFDVLMQLDSWESPGISRAEFTTLFVKCHVCGFYMTRRTFDEHVCHYRKFMHVVY